MTYSAYSITFFYVFFFQAEDGIRDLVRSRGLGDVYKRQSFFIVIDPDWYRQTDAARNPRDHIQLISACLHLDSVSFHLQCVQFPPNHLRLHQVDPLGRHRLGAFYARRGLHPVRRLAAPVSYTHLTLPTIYSV
eukprot:TRINITY_DN27476_c0_g1_i1.p1 TRINITY_DN27476_c0_g1~~TRINITY_DN27476_c0_g1_i1.p1  ORF type:complete len:134 (-),score=47.97 TRINITY_DN27476_c0_g1_i1:69-470(-)